LIGHHKHIPTLACLLVGTSEESQLYVKMKERTLREQLHFQTNIYHFPSLNTHLSQLKELINSLNNDSTIHGILVQLPLPYYLRDEQDNLLKLIHPYKDVDGLLYPNSPFVPCTPQGIQWLLDWYGVKLAGKNVVVVGASKLVGK
jgi:methylenetetrahydrofolate dehydrogenase (NADP+)/methenyltetrahydrofolate cyclohydrolase